MLAFPSTKFFLISSVIFGAGIVRGATGFGFSLIMMVFLTIFYPPATIVPILLLWDVVASCLHLPFLWRDVDWKSMRWLGLGAVTGTPIGVYLLTSIPVQPMCFTVNALVLIMAFLLFLGKRPQKTPGPVSAVGVGLTTGIINGAAAASGPPVLLFYAVDHDAASTRASFIAFFLVIDLFGFILMLHNGLMTAESLSFSVVLSIPMFSGMVVGHKLAASIPDAKLRKLVILLLIMLAFSGTIRSWFEL